MTNESSAAPSALVSTSAAERRVYRCNKRFYVVALPGDTYASIGKWAGKSERRLRRYNEVPRRAALSPGDPSLSVRRARVFVSLFPYRILSFCPTAMGPPRGMPLFL